MAQSIGFETTKAWQASVGEVRSNSWITISPTSGPAGKNNISVTLTSNTSENSRTAVITITSGGDFVEITVTQRGIGEPEEPEEPIHPEVTPENRLTLIELTQRETYNSMGEIITSQDEYTLVLTYDNQGQLGSYTIYSIADEQPESIDAQDYTEFKWNTGKLSIKMNSFDIYDSYIDPDYNEKLPFIRTYEYTGDCLLNGKGLISQHTDSEGRTTEYAYNADGTLKSMQHKSANGARKGETTFTWDNGNLKSTHNTSDSHSETTTFTYTEHLSPWHGVDIGSILSDSEEISLLGITGQMTKNLPKTRQGENTDQFEYTFDAEGRISTIVINSTWGTPSDGHSREEYKLHYGERPTREFLRIPYVHRQEVTDEGTLNYTFDRENPEEHHINQNAYTSYVKIRSMLTDGTIREYTKYAQVIMHVPQLIDGGYPIFSVDQKDVDNFRFIGHTLTKDDEHTDGHPGSNSLFTLTLNYNGLSVELKSEVYYPYYHLYSATTGKMEDRPMPILPIDADCVTVLTPTVTEINAEAGIYLFNQEFIWQPIPVRIPETSYFTGELHTKSR